MDAARAEREWHFRLRLHGVSFWGRGWGVQAAEAERGTFTRGFASGKEATATNRKKFRAVLETLEARMAGEAKTRNMFDCKSKKIE